MARRPPVVLDEFERDRAEVLQRATLDAADTAKEMADLAGHVSAFLGVYSDWTCRHIQTRVPIANARSRLAKWDSYPWWQSVLARHSDLEDTKSVFHDMREIDAASPFLLPGVAAFETTLVQRGLEMEVRRADDVSDSAPSSSTINEPRTTVEPFLPDTAPDSPMEEFNRTTAALRHRSRDAHTETEEYIKWPKSRYSHVFLRPHTKKRSDDTSRGPAALKVFPDIPSSSPPPDPETTHAIPVMREVKETPGGEVSEEWWIQTIPQDPSKSRCFSASKLFQQGPNGSLLPPGKDALPDLRANYDYSITDPDELARLWQLITRPPRPGSSLEEDSPSNDGPNDDLPGQEPEPDIEFSIPVKHEVKETPDGKTSEEWWFQTITRDPSKSRVYRRGTPSHNKGGLGGLMFMPLLPGRPPNYDQSIKDPGEISRMWKAMREHFARAAREDEEIYRRHTLRF